MQAWKHLIMNCRRVSRVPGACEWFDWHKKYAGELSLPFKESRIHWGFNCPHRRKSKGLRSKERGAIQRKLSVCGHTLIRTFFPVLVWGKNSYNLSKNCVCVYIYIYICIGKGKLHPRTGYESPEGE